MIPSRLAEIYRLRWVADFAPFAAMHSRKKTFDMAILPQLPGSPLHVQLHPSREGDMVIP